MRTKCVPPLTNFEIRSYKLGNKPLKLQGTKLALVISTGTPSASSTGSRREEQPARETLTGVQWR
jgi:hypothetical protein